MTAEIPDHALFMLKDEDLLAERWAALVKSEKHIAAAPRNRGSGKPTQADRIMDFLSDGEWHLRGEIEEGAQAQNSNKSLLKLVESGAVEKRTIRGYVGEWRRVDVSR